jgi:hypothetical protein
MGTLIKRGYIQLPKMREKEKRIKKPKEHTKKAHEILSKS